MVFGCLQVNSDRPGTPPNVEVVNYDTLLRKTDDGWLYEGQLFSGYMVEKERDGRIVYRLPILDGRENGVATGWYNTGEKLLVRLFIDGKKEGQFRQWWPNGKLRYAFQYKDDEYDGLQRVYFPTGKKREESTYLAGEQEGPQRVWNESGQLVSNYTIRYKRTYGIVSVKSCMPVSHL
ncbi:hypothetical protein J2I46_27485 [Fibrella sp. HMF5405]|uniref:Toxin-antitoxin system YwqK family antitoxin n=2 Tax=Fibrella forsythiae TaxID=2817061 RepID=A0ABS3JQR3_9BACT|nr:hypothetical protein [Fibrella forsythiae]